MAVNLSGTRIAHFNKIFKYRPYYAGIMLDAFGHLIRFTLCQHNRPVPKGLMPILSYQSSRVHNKLLYFSYIQSV